MFVLPNIPVLHVISHQHFLLQVLFAILEITNYVTTDDMALPSVVITYDSKKINHNTMTMIYAELSASSKPGHTFETMEMLLGQLPCHVNPSPTPPEPIWDTLLERLTNANTEPGALKKTKFVFAASTFDVGDTPVHQTAMGKALHMLRGCNVIILGAKKTAPYFQSVCSALDLDPAAIYHGLPNLAHSKRLVIGSSALLTSLFKPVAAPFVPSRVVDISMVDKGVARSFRLMLTFPEGPVELPFSLPKGFYAFPLENRPLMACHQGLLSRNTLLDGMNPEKMGKRRYNKAKRLLSYEANKRIMAGFDPDTGDYKSFKRFLESIGSDNTMVGAISTAKGPTMLSKSMRIGMISNPLPCKPIFPNS